MTFNQEPKQGQHPTLENSTGFECSECGGVFFKNAIQIHKYKGKMVMEYFMRCEDCSSVLEELRNPPLPESEEIEEVHCENCDGEMFRHALIPRRWSKLLLGLPEDHIDFVPAFKCDDCGDILKEFFPRGMKDIEQKLNLGDPESVQIHTKPKLITS